MPNRLLRYFSPTENWPLFCFLLLCFVMLKGIAYLAIMPPFEGWDEYQRVGFIKYLEDHHERPILDKSFISRELVEDIVPHPVPQAMFDQIHATGAVVYKDYFAFLPSIPVYNEDHKDIRLYQAQHGALYYRLASFLTEPVAFADRLIDKIYLLRLINLGMTAATFAIILAFLSRIHQNRARAAALALLVCSQPILLLNGCRVANDPLAILTGTVAIVIALTPQLRKRVLFSIIAGAAIGIACWTKSIAAILFPFWFCCLFVAWFDGEISPRRMILLSALTCSMALMVLFEYFRFNVEHYNMLFVMQESIVNSNNQRTLFDILTAVSPLTLGNDLLLKWGEGAIWSGGWSFLRVRDVRNIVKVLMIVSICGWIFRLFVSSKQPRFFQDRTSFLCLCLVVLTSMALSWHYLQSALAWGHATTNAWYISISLAFFMLFLANGAYQWSNRTGFGVVLGLTCVYIYSDLRGMITMMYHYSGEAYGLEALRRVASLHPAGLGAPTLFAALSILLVTIVLLLASVIGAQPVRKGGSEQM